MLFKFLSVPAGLPVALGTGRPVIGLIERFVLAGWQLLLFYGGAILLAFLLYLGRRYRLVRVGRKAVPR